MDVAFYTLGCKVNQWETGAMERLLEAAGHRIVSWDAPADAYVVNTCTVTAVSDKKSRQMIRQTRRNHPGALLCVCGCLSQSDPDAVRLAADVDLIAGSGQRADFVRALEGRLAERRASSEFVGKSGCQAMAPAPVTTSSFYVGDASERTCFESLPGGNVSGRTRALLKIQDGCDRRCTYCIIPSVRGPGRSLPPDDAVLEAERLSREGFREIVVTGIEIASYGRDLEDISLSYLLERLSRAAPASRLRLGSLEPGILTNENIARWAALPNLCPHFHVSLQAGCDRTLARMGRRYATGDYEAALARLRAAFPGCAVTTDLMVGFPGETGEDFETTLTFLARCAFASMHIFPYSRRAGTPAADFDGGVPRAEKQRRAKEAARLAASLAARYRASCLNRTLSVLFETEEAGVSIGRAENNQRVRCFEGQTKGTLQLVHIEGETDEMLFGRIV